MNKVSAEKKKKKEKLVPTQARLEAERKYNNKAGSRNELQAMMQRRKLRGTILAVDALAQEKIADYFAPTVTHSSS